MHFYHYYNFLLSLIIGFDTFKEELGSSRDTSLRRETSLNGTYEEQDIMKVFLSTYLKNSTYNSGLDIA